MSALILAVLISVPAVAADLEGPARFCGYAPIIDLLPGEKVTTLHGGIHGGSFRWEGAFGAMEVAGVGSASRPKGRIESPGRGGRPATFAQRRADEGYVIAIWNGAQGAAYFTSPEPFTALQRQAIRRVSLYQEGETPSGCSLRTMFVWD